VRLTSVVVAATLAVAGCATTQPINNVVDAPFSYPQGKSLSSTELQRAIVNAGTGLGWVMQPVAPGKLNGRLMLRTHLAEIDIEYSTRTYSIKYRDSQNLDAHDGMIHRQYNAWIANLDKAIQSNVNNAANLK